MVKLAFIAGFLGLSLFGAKSVFAASEYSSRTEWGAQDVSAYGDNDELGYNRSISGASWYYYEIPDSETYTENDKIYVPVANDNPYSPKVAVPARTCQSYGGFWVLLRNEYNRETGELTNRPASAIKLSDIRSTDLPAGTAISNPTNIIAFKNNRTGGPEDSLGGVKATKYGNMNDVLAEFNNYAGTTAIPLAAVDNPGELSYFCAGTKPSQQIPLDSFSTVTVGDDGATSAPVLNKVSYLGGDSDNEASAIAIPIGSELPEITFSSYLARPFSEHDLKSSSDGIDYTFITSGESSNGKINLKSLNNRENRWDFGGVSYLYSEKATKTISGLGTMGSSRLTICHNVTFINNDVYNSSTLELDGSGEVTSGACITFVPVPALNGSVVTDCEAGGDGKYTHKSVIGNTVATVGVSKNNGPPSTTTAAATVEPSVAPTVYAKPGDVIRFSYAICFGANDVNYAGSMITQGTQSGGNAIDSWFRVYLGSKNDEQPSLSSLLFGNQSALLGGEIYADKTMLRRGRFIYDYSGGDSADDVSERYEIKDSSYWLGKKRQLSFSSPDAHEDVSINISGNFSSSDPTDEEGSNIVENYGCAFYSGLSSSESTGYVIPGLEGATKDIDCDSAFGPKYLDGTSITSAVGATINHSLEYSYVAAWPIRNNSSKVTVTNLEDIISGYNDAYNQIVNGSNPGLANSPGRAVSSGNAEADIVTKTAKVAIPYNFDTNIAGKITDNDSQTVYPGETLNYSARVDVLPRENPVTSDKVAGGEYVPYATTMPSSTKVELVEFLVKDTADSSVKDKLKQDYLPDEYKNPQSIDNIRERPNYTAEICKYYDKILGDDLEDCESNTVRGLTADGVIGNGTSNPEGEQNYYNEEVPFVVPDVKAGYKYCIAVAVSYGDSHGFPGEKLSATEGDLKFGANGISVNGLFSTSMSYHWRTANASCRTVVKKPSFQVWNGGVYSSNNITSSTTEKSVNARLADLTPGSPRPEDKENARKVAMDPVYFGSWAEYYVVAKGKISGFASASGLGFTTNFGSLTTDGYGRPYDYCNLSRLTIANLNCKNNVAGEYAIPQDTDIKDLKKEITDFYVPSVSAVSDRYYSGSYANKYSEVSSGDYFPGEWNGAQVLIRNGDFIIDRPIPQSSGTLVLKINGHLTINDNICLGEGICKDVEATKYTEDYSMNTNNLSLENRNTTVYNSIKDIPQVIIIAESISIGSDVSQIDAWLITNSENDNYDGGYINTCNEFQSGQTGTSQCWKTLKINGPVITTALLLNRTGGAWPGFSGDVGNQAYKTLSDRKLVWKQECEARGITGKRKIARCVDELAKNYVYSLNLDDETSAAMIAAYEAADRYGAQSDTYSSGRSLSRDLTCDGSITPAEIFDLHPIIYYWSYAQSQKIAQAIVTYSQELSPRY